jgi:predicted solute-binding protein
VIEMARQGLACFRGAGIACRGPVRSILLVSKVPFPEIRTLAADSGSRTSVVLARVILAERFGVQPRLVSRPADLAPMLGEADAALLIGDPALRLSASAGLPFETLDLGGECTLMTGLPMVFALWSGRKSVIEDRYERAFLDSCRYGLSHMDEIVRNQAPARGVSEAVARDYLTRRIVFELDDCDHAGLDMFLKSAARFEPAAASRIGV